MSDPLGALSEGATSPHQTSDPSAVAAKEVFRRRLLTTTRNQSLIVNHSNDPMTSKPPPPPPPEYAPPSPPRRGTVLGIPGGKAPAGLVASSDGGRKITSQLIPSAVSSVVPKSSYAAAAAAVEQRLLHKSINGQGEGGKDDPHNGGVRSPIPKSIGYRPRQRQPSSSDTSGKQIFFVV